MEPIGLAAMVEKHLVEKAKAGKVTEGWIKECQHHLQRAIDFFGAERPVHTISKEDVKRWIRRLEQTPSGRTDADGKPRTLSSGTVRHHINALSNLFKRASSTHVPSGYNPVAELMEKPSAKRREAEWLEVPDAALVLEAARTYTPTKNKNYCALEDPFPIIATFLLTGGRKSEVLGLDVEDVSFDKKIIRFRPNEHRRLKTSTLHRNVPLWPQLEEILREYVFGGSAPASGLLFPSPTGPGRIKDMRKVLDSLADDAGVDRLRTKMFRHTYCAARLQTFDEVVRGYDDNGEPSIQAVPVAKYTVAKEMGHGGTALVDRVYGHLGNIQHRAATVEYRADQHKEELGERLTALRAA